MPLFQHSVTKKYSAGLDKPALNAAFEKFSAFFHDPERQKNIREAKEEQFQEGFLRELFVNVLGYVLNPDPGYNLTTEHRNVKDSRKADGAILFNGEVVGVIELKGADTTDLAKVENQAFGYKNNQPGCRYVIISNFEKLRFYIDNAIDHLEFNLFALDAKGFELLWLCLACENLKSGFPARIKEESLSHETGITKALYTDYSLFKRELYKNLTERNPQYDSLTLFKKSQKLLSRLLFLFFSEDRNLLPPNSVRLVLNDWRELKERDAEVPLYDRFKKYFGYLNTGFKGKRYDVFPYNGGLFKPDLVLDAVAIDDELLYRHALKLSEYDFVSEIDVNILGHIFENSLNELEEIRAQLEGTTVDKAKTKRKKEGVYYTPRYITKYIVENTVGRLCREKRETLGIVDEDYTDSVRRQTKTRQALLDKLTAYREWLLQLTICDPACGSGAFLNQALEFLIAEHRSVDELQARLFGDAMVLSDLDKSILENNLYGVDLNEESVEIARLSLWLRTARPNRTLNDLSNNIKVGNSLIDDPAVAGDKAFDWHKEFPHVFAKGGFDVVIGNPPWGAKNNDLEQIFLLKKFPIIPTKIKDSYLYFSLQNINVVCANGCLGIIIPNTWLLINNGVSFRRKILSYEVLNIIDHGDGVFEDAIVESTTLILRKTASNNNTCHTSREKFGKRISDQHIDKTIWLSDELCRIVIDQDNSYTMLEEKLSFNTEKFGKNCEIIFGIKPYQIGLGHPPQTKEDVYNRIYHSTIKEGPEWFPLITGTDINRYSLTFKNDAFIKYGKWLMYCSDADKINHDKLVLRRTSADLRVAFDNLSYYPQNSIFILTSKKFQLKYLLTILNSKLFDFIYRNKCPQIGKIFAEVKPSIIKSLPIKCCDDAKQLTFALIADKMLTLHKDLHSLTCSFHRSLQRHFGLAEGPAKLNSWYQMGYGEFVKEVRKRRVPLTLAQEAEWEGYFEAEAAKALELKRTIDATDREIDRMVYELYGLTEEEIAVVEGRNNAS